MSEQANPKSGVPKSGVPKSGVPKSGAAKSGPVEEVVPDCPHCGKPLPLCICDSVSPIKSKISLLILQHPQGAGQDARHRAADGAAFQGCGRQNRPVLAKPVQGVGTESR